MRRVSIVRPRVVEPMARLLGFRGLHRLISRDSDLRWLGGRLMPMSASHDKLTAYEDADGFLSVHSAMLEESVQVVGMIVAFHCDRSAYENDKVLSSSSFGLIPMLTNSLEVTARFGLLLLVGILPLAPRAQAQSMVATDQSVAPGQLHEVQNGRLANLFTRWTNFEGTAVQNRIGSIAIENGQHYFYCSGLDGCVFEYNGKDEITLVDVGQQVRHVAFDRSQNLLYYSMVETPQDGQALADGVVCAMDLNTRRTIKTFRIAQANLKGEFFGAIAANNGLLYMATDSTVYSYNNGTWGEVIRSRGEVIRGIASSPWGQLYFVDGTKGVYAFEKSGAVTKLHTLNTTSLTHIGWLPEEKGALVEGGKLGDSGAAPRTQATSSIQGNVQGLTAAQRSQVRVTLTSEIGFARSVGLDSRGHFMINPLPAGKYTVSVRSSDSSIRFANSSQTIILGDRVSQQLLFSAQGVAGNVSLPVPANSSIQGAVVGLAAFRMNRTRVTVESRDGSINRQASLNERGFFMIDRLPAGRYSIKIVDQSGGQIGRAKEVTLAPLSSQQVSLSVQ